MSIAMLMTMASCSSSDDEVAENNNTEVKLVPMTFTATQETNVGTRAVLNSSNNVDWEATDKISVFDGIGTENNHKFTLTGTVAEGKFSGTASETATKFTAVYPYTAGATLGEDGKVSGITLPAEQTATLNSFDPNAALMMAYTVDKTKLDFKNAVSLVKIKTDFDCKKIVLTANEDIAGTGTLTYDTNTDIPSFSINSETSKFITLKPATGGENIAAGTYYIVVPPTTLSGFSISFTATDDKEYIRKSTKSNTFYRSKIKDFGSFATDGEYWYDAARGDKVRADQEVDLGLTIIIGTKNYKVIFAKSNLTKGGLAENEYDYGDYFAWGAFEPWYISYSGTSLTESDLKPGKTGGYKQANAPFYNGSSYTKYMTSGETLDAADDAAKVILGGNWQLPTKKIWQALSDASTFEWGNGGNKQLETIVGSTIKGMKITKIDDPSTYLFLPAAGGVYGTSFYSVGTDGYYWSGTASSSTGANDLSFYRSNVNAQDSSNRYYGYSVRPVRLVAVN